MSCKYFKFTSTGVYVLFVFALMSITFIVTLSRVCFALQPVYKGVVHYFTRVASLVASLREVVSMVVSFTVNSCIYASCTIPANLPLVIASSALASSVLWTLHPTCHLHHRRTVQHVHPSSIFVPRHVPLLHMTSRPHHDLSMSYNQA